MASQELAEADLSPEAEAILLRAWEIWRKQLERELDKVFYPYGTEDL